MDYSSTSPGYHQSEPERRIIPGTRESDDVPAYDMRTKDFGHFDGDCRRHDVPPTMFFPRDGKKWCIDCYNIRYGHSPLGDPKVEWTVPRVVEDFI